MMTNNLIQLTFPNLKHWRCSSPFLQITSMACTFDQKWSHQHRSCSCVVKLVLLRLKLDPLRHHNRHFHDVLCCCFSFILLSVRGNKVTICTLTISKERTQKLCVAIFLSQTSLCSFATSSLRKTSHTFLFSHHSWDQRITNIKCFIYS